MAAERSGRPGDRTQVARVRDPVESDDQRRLAPRRRSRRQVGGVGVLIRGDPQRQALVDRASGQPVQFRPSRLDHRDAGLRRQGDRLAHAVVDVQPRARVQGDRGNGGAQRLQDRVAAGDHLGRVTGPSLPPRAYAGNLTRCGGARPAAAIGTGPA